MLPDETRWGKEVHRGAPVQGGWGALVDLLKVEVHVEPACIHFQRVHSATCGLQPPGQLNRAGPSYLVFGPPHKQARSPLPPIFPPLIFEFPSQETLTEDTLLRLNWDGPCSSMTTSILLHPPHPLADPPICHLLCLACERVGDTFFKRAWVRQVSCSSPGKSTSPAFSLIGPGSTKLALKAYARHGAPTPAASPSHSLTVTSPDTSWFTSKLVDISWDRYNQVLGTQGHDPA